MAQLNTRRIVRQCFVPGCGNTDSYMVYRGIEPWAKVVICKKCADELNAILNPFVPSTVEIVAEKEGKNEEKTGEKDGKVAPVDAEKPATTPKTTRKKAEAK